MSCDCILCVVRTRNAPMEMTEADHDRLLDEDTTDCHPRETNDLCGGCGRCLRMQRDYYASKRLEDLENEQSTS